MHRRHQTLFSPLPHVCHRASVAHLPSCVPLGKIWQFSYLYGTQKGETMTTTSEAVELFLASLRTRSAPAHTIKSYSHDLRHFVQAVPADLASVSAPAIQIFLDGDGHHSPATRGRRYSTLCALYMYVIHPASFVERVPEAGSCSSVGERAVGALASPPDGFPVLSQALARWVPPRFDGSHPGPTLPSLAGKRTAGSCGLSTTMMVPVSRDARTPLVPSAGKPPRFCLECRYTACANPRSIRLPAFSCPLSSCSPLSHRPPLLDLLCVNTTRSA
jgi:hypothetical protein